MKKHLFLTGERQIGKSTAIRRFLEAAGDRGLLTGRTGGFRSVKTDFEDGTAKVYLVSLTDPVFDEDHVFMELGAWHKKTARDPEEENFDETPGGFSRPFGEKGPLVKLDVFNREGVRLLKETEGCSLILMDEIGFAESNAEEFRQAVLDVLDGDCPVLGVLRKDETPFLRQLRERPDVLLLTVTEENRDLIPELLLFGLSLNGNRLDNCSVIGQEKE